MTNALIASSPAEIYDITISSLSARVRLDANCVTSNLKWIGDRQTARFLETGA